MFLIESSITAKLVKKNGPKCSAKDATGSKPCEAPMEVAGSMVTDRLAWPAVSALSSDPAITGRSWMFAPLAGFQTRPSASALV